MPTRLFSRTDGEDVFTKASKHEADGDTVDADTSDDQPAPQATSDEAHDDRTDPADDEGEVESTETVPATRTRRLRYALAGVIALIFILALSTSGYLGWKVKQRNDIDHASQAALAAAQAFTVNLTSIDTSKVDQNFNDVVNASTGEFKDAYTQSATQLRQILIDNKALSKGTVIDSAVKAASKDKADVILFVDQWITNSVDPKPRLDRSRVALTMKLVDGKWLAEKVDLK